MSGHNKWKKIKHKKTAEDQGRGKLFSKLSNEISIAARSGVDPQFNASLRSAIDRARKQNMPQINIERAIKKVTERGDSDSLLIEAYGPEGAGVIIEALTDNKNRTVSELRSVLRDYDSKIAQQGSLMWSFEKTDEGYGAKLPTDVSEGARVKINSLSDELRAMDDVVGVYTSIKDS